MHITTIPWADAPHNYETEQAPQVPPPALTEEDFPALSKDKVHHNHSPLVPANQTWADIASFDRFSRWDALPFDIQELVIYYQMHSSGYIGNELDIDEWRQDCGGAMSTTMPPFLPPICFTSKQMLSDAVPVYIAGVEWKVRSMRANLWLTEFLTNLTVEANGLTDEVGFKSLRDIHFSSFHRFAGVEALGRNLDMELMKRCSGLKTLILTFHVSVMLKTELEPESIVNVKDIREIVDMYGLGDIFLCRSLKKFKIDGITRTGYRKDAEDRMVDLANWVRDEFLQRWNQVVEVDVVWRTHSMRRRYYKDY
jgi:hypothetical protein